MLRFERPDAWAELADHLQEAEARDWCETDVLPVLAGIAPDLDTYAGEDFARRGDLTSLWIAQRRQDMGFACVLLLELRNVPYEIQKTIVFYVLSRLPRLRAGVFDATGNGGYLAEAAAKKFRGRAGANADPGLLRGSDAEIQGGLRAGRDRHAAGRGRIQRPPGDPPCKGRPRKSHARNNERGKVKAARAGKSVGTGDAAIAHLLCYAASLADNAPPVPRVLSGGVRRSASLLSGYDHV